MPAYNAIESVVVDVSFLKGKIVENRASHLTNYEAAATAYREKAVKLLNQRAKKLKNGSTENLYFDLPLPTQYLSSYDQALRMLEHHQGEQIELSGQAFMQLVEDKWGWSDHFAANTMFYNGAPE